MKLLKLNEELKHIKVFKMW